MKYQIDAYDRNTGEKVETISNTADEAPVLFESREQAENWIEVFGQFIEQDFKVVSAAA
jgi:hypothetical protein